MNDIVLDYLSTMVETARELLVAQSVGAVPRAALVEWADAQIAAADKPPYFLIAMSMGEPPEDEDRLDFHKNPIDDNDCSRVVARVTDLALGGEEDLRTLSKICLRLGQKVQDGALVGSLLWLSDEIDLCLGGYKDLQTSMPEIRRELKHCVEYAA